MSVTDDGAVPNPLDDPAFKAGYLFCALLADETATTWELSYLVTPESLPAWGDFSEAVRLHNSLKDPAFCGTVVRSDDDKRIAYLLLLGGVQQHLVLDDWTDPDVTITLHWSEDRGWLVHQYWMH